MIFLPHKPTVSHQALDAYERQSGLPDVARFLVETGRVVLVETPEKSTKPALIARSNQPTEGNNNHAAAISQ